MSLTRVSGALVKPVMFIRPRRPEDHKEFDWLLPQCSAMFVYADANGRDWVRWSLPREVAAKLGWTMKCACCDHTEEHTTDAAHAYMIDTAYDEVSWHLDERRDT